MTKISKLNTGATFSSMDYAAIFFISVSLLLRLFYMTQGSLLVEEAYYWNYGQHLDFSYLDHPPMVAVLIKFFTTIFGLSEFSVRLPAFLCWVLTAFFSCKLSELIRKGTGLYVLMFLSVLPFFFVQSMAMTPDQPMIACWAAVLYCLYRVFILEQPKYWYAAGVWLGLGLISKYTIILLVPSALLYVCIVPSARSWLLRKEPYLAALIAILLFSPVIYWNATHEWASFAFQTTRRMSSQFSFSFHYFLGLLLFFLLPTGLYGFGLLMRKNKLEISDISSNTKLFLQIFTLFPLIFFGAFSLTHPLKFDWIGPCLLALLPWLAILVQNNTKLGFCFFSMSTRASWLITFTFLFVSLGFVINMYRIEFTHGLYRQLFVKFIDWDELTQHIHALAQRVELETHIKPVIVPLDTYNIASELSFYQAKYAAEHPGAESYTVIGSHIFGHESLMYKYWDKTPVLRGQTMLLVTQTPNDFVFADQSGRIIERAPKGQIWSSIQMDTQPVVPFYYRVVEYR